MTMSLAPKKIALVHVAKKKLGLDDDSYRAMLLRVAGVRSCRKLDDHGFTEVMHVFQLAGFTSDFGKANLGHREGMASPGQVAMIRTAWTQFTDGQGNDGSLGKWLARIVKRSALQFLTAADARKAIGALANMNRRKAAKAAREAGGG